MVVKRFHCRIFSTQIMSIVEAIYQVIQSVYSYATLVTKIEMKVSQYQNFLLQLSKEYRVAIQLERICKYTPSFSGSSCIKS